MVIEMFAKNISLHLFVIVTAIIISSSMMMMSSVLAQQTSTTISGFDIPITLDEVDTVGFDTSIVIDIYGNPVISYFDLANEDLKLFIV